MSNPDETRTSTRSRNQAPTHVSSNQSASATSSEEDDQGAIESSLTDSQGYTDGAESSDDEDSGWASGVSKSEVGPSESASRTSDSNLLQQRLAPANSRRHSRREGDRIRLTHRTSRPRRGQHPPSDESVESHEELYAEGLRHHPRRYMAPPGGGGQGYPYAPSNYSQNYGPYAGPNGVQQAQALVPFNNGPPQYQYSPYNAPPPHQQQQQQPGYYPPNQAAMPPPGHGMHHPTQSPYQPHEMMHAPQMPGYFPYPAAAYQIPHQIAPSPIYQFPHVYASTPHRQASPAKEDAGRDSEGYAELKQMLIREKAEREEREARAKRMEEERIAKAEADKKKAEDIAEAAKKAYAEATTEAEKKAAEKAEADAKKAAEEAAKIKAEADKAIQEAKEAKEAREATEKEVKEVKEAAAAAVAAAAVPEEKKKPIKFKDAVGRKFSFPFHLCATWEGMEDLIRQAFLHVDVIGPHVAEGHYDLIGPNNEIILPAVWETVVEPDWTITMHMWPLPEPKPEDEPPIVDVPPPPDAAAAAATAAAEKKKGKGKKKAAPASDGPPPPPPPPVPPAAGGSAPPAQAKKKKQSSFSLFSGGRPKAKPKAAAGAAPAAKK